MKKLSVSIILAFLVTGCTPEVAEWTPAESPKKNKVQRVVEEFEIRYPAHHAHMNDGERRKLEDFLSQSLGNPDAVQVYVTEYGGHGKDRIQVLKKILGHYGVSGSRITIDPPSHGSLRTGSGVVITVEKYMVTPPSCHDWSRSFGDAQGHAAMSNLGCATETNLAMMIADPRDLVSGKPTGYYDGTRHALGVQMYREDKVKKLKEESVGGSSGGGAS